MKRFLGEGGKKRVYLAQDTLLDREVAFALIKTEGGYTLIVTEKSADRSSVTGLRKPSGIHRSSGLTLAKGRTN